LILAPRLYQGWLRARFVADLYPGAHGQNWSFSADPVNRIREQVIPAKLFAGTDHE